MKKSGVKKKEKDKKHNIYEDDIDQKQFNKKKALIHIARETLNFNEILSLTHNIDEEVRLKALQRLCPCRVGEEHEQFWNRIFEMVKDPSPAVRFQVLHNICDGSPDSMEERVKDALEFFNRDEDREVRRKAHKVIASYMRTGKWNIL